MHLYRATAFSMVGGRSRIAPARDPRGPGRWLLVARQELGLHAVLTEISSKRRRRKMQVTQRCQPTGGTHVQISFSSSVPNTLVQCKVSSMQANLGARSAGHHC